jgi:succinate dehydrogenase / fumarate reductase membrane anchor subunit
MDSATGLTGSGSRDWVVQRVSAIVLAVYTFVIFGWILCQSLNHTLDYAAWSGFKLGHDSCFSRSCVDWDLDSID